MNRAPACMICDSPLVRACRPWLGRCPSCGQWSAALEVQIATAAPRMLPDAAAIASGLRELRRANYQRIFDRLARFFPLPGKRLLDVGCSTGFFLELARARGLETYGLEPEPTLAALARPHACGVTVGFFPEDLDRARRFDLLTFNDVLEHLPNVPEALAACRAVLSDEGVLVLNLPDSAGLLYRTAVALDRAGFGKPLDRMWQVGFPSPHLQYFNGPRLVRLCARHGWAHVGSHALASVTLKGLWSRLRFDRRSSAAFNVVAWLSVALASPLLRVLPQDITVHYFRKAALPVASA